MSRTGSRAGDAWSRRKAKVAEAEAAEARARAAAQAAARAEALEARPDAEICAELGLPEPEQMQPGDDFAAFLRSEVPARLRQRALRRLWSSNPVLANVDGLVDYGEDFTGVTAPAGEVLRTAYRVGRGFADKLAQTGAEMAQADMAQEPRAPAVPGQDTAERPVEGADQSAEEPPAAPARPARRMRFRFRDRAPGAQGGHDHIEGDHIEADHIETEQA